MQITKKHAIILIHPRASVPCAKIKPSFQSSPLPDHQNTHKHFKTKAKYSIVLRVRSIKYVQRNAKK